MLVNCKVFKKVSPNGRLSLYMLKREFVDCVTQVEPIDGVVLLDNEYIQQKRKVFVQLICHFRYGREEDESMGLRFQKELILTSQQLHSPENEDIQLRKVQESLLNKLGSNAFPFVLEMPMCSPASVALQQKSSDTSIPCGLHYYVKVFAADSDSERPHRRSTICLNVRKVQYAPKKQGIQPCTVVRKEFLLSPGELELEATLDKQLYLHGEKIGVNILVRNNSNKAVKKIRVSVQQGIDMLLFQHGEVHHTIAQLESSDGCPINPSSSLQKTFLLLPTLSDNYERVGIAVEGDLKHQEMSLASTPLVTQRDRGDAFGILVSYRVKIKLILSALAGEVCAELPFKLMHPKPDRKLQLKAKSECENTDQLAADNP